MINLDFWLRLSLENNVNNLLDFDIKDNHFSGKAQGRKTMIDILLICMNNLIIQT